MERSSTKYLTFSVEKEGVTYKLFIEEGYYNSNPSILSHYSNVIQVDKIEIDS